MTQVGASEELEGAPAANDARKPRSPFELTRPSWNLVMRRTLRGFVAHQLPDGAATLTYYALLSLLPSLVALISLAALFGEGRRSADALLKTIDDVAPGSALALLRDPLDDFIKSPSVGTALIISVAIAIWATSSYVGGFGRAMNRIYEIDEGRPLWKLKPFQIAIALVIMVLVLITIATVVLTGPVVQGVGSSVTGTTVWTVLKWPLLVLAVMLAVAILFYATPNAHQPKFRWMSGGAFISVVVLVAVSLLFAVYVRNFAHFDRTYRSFAGIIAVLLWLWIANLTLLFGAEFDAQFERARQLEAGIRAEQKIQLPPRDTEVSERNAAKVEKQIADGRAIREASGLTPHE